MSTALDLIRRDLRVDSVEVTASVRGYHYEIRLVSGWRCSEYDWHTIYADTESEAVAAFATIEPCPAGCICGYIAPPRTAADDLLNEGSQMALAALLEIR